MERVIQGRIEFDIFINIIVTYPSSEENVTIMLTSRK